MGSLGATAREDLSSPSMATTKPRNAPPERHNPPPATGHGEALELVKI